MTRAGIYIRKSRQDKGQAAYRLELQRTKLPEYARSQGWIVEVYDDGIISGSEVDTRREMVRLIADIEAGKINPEYENTNLRQKLEEVRKLCAQQYEAKNQTFLLLCEETIHITIDAHFLQEILLNLIQNVQFSQKQRQNKMK